MSSDTPSPPGSPPHHLEQQRRENRELVRALGLDPYGARSDGLLEIAAARDRYDAAADAAHQAAGKAPPPDYADRRAVVAVAGRVVLLRDNGKLVWITLRDASGDLQVALSQRDADETSFKLAKLLDLGDVVAARGPLMRTRTGELTLWAASLAPGAKCLLPPPEKHAGLHDPELRYRRRYVDMWATPQTLRVLQARSRIVARVRRSLDERGFLEVETPMLQPLAGGAAARPFTTRMHALDLPLFLRIAPELYLKRLLVGGMPRVYELGRNFRNEGLDKRHNPEFTSLEVYQAWGDVRTMMDLAEDLIRELAGMIAREFPPEGAPDAPGPPARGAHLILPMGELNIDYAAPFRRLAYGELFEAALGFPMEDHGRVRAAVVEHHLARRIKGAELPAGATDREALALLETLDPALLVNTLFEELAEARLDPARPTFVTDYPAAISPLTRARPDNPALADRADLFIAGMEIGPFYTELNDPDVQEARFREQLRGLDAEESTFRTFDQDFIDALKVGMPPAGGLGLGIDRLVMLLTNQRSIRDAILFPLMRPLPASEA